MRNAYNISGSSKDVLAFILRYKAENKGSSPSVREIVEGCGFGSTSVAHYHLSRLQEAGLIEREAGKARNIHVKGESWSFAGRGQ